MECEREGGIMARRAQERCAAAERARVAAEAEKVC